MPNKCAILEHRNSAHIFIPHHAGKFFDGRFGLGRLDINRHNLAYDRHSSSFASSKQNSGNFRLSYFENG
jgi:hypothetical protein